MSITNSVMLCHEFINGKQPQERKAFSSLMMNKYCTFSIIMPDISCLKNEQKTWGLVEKRQIYKLAFWQNSKPVKFASNSTLGKQPASTRAWSCQESHELAWQGPRLLWQNPFSRNLDLTKAREKEIDIKCWASASRAQELQFSSEQTVLSGKLSGCSDWLETDEDKHQLSHHSNLWINLATLPGMSNLATTRQKRAKLPASPLLYFSR